MYLTLQGHKGQDGEYFELMCLDLRANILSFPSIIKANVLFKIGKDMFKAFLFPLYYKKYFFILKFVTMYIHIRITSKNP